MFGLSRLFFFLGNLRNYPFTKQSDIVMLGVTMKLSLALNNALSEITEIYRPLYLKLTPGEQLPYANNLIRYPIVTTTTQFYSTSWMIIQWDWLKLLNNPRSTMRCCHSVSCDSICIYKCNYKAKIVWYYLYWRPQLFSDKIQYNTIHLEIFA